MKTLITKGNKHTLVFIGLLWLIVCNVTAQTTLPNKAKQLVTLMQKNHYKPNIINDSFSVHLFDRIVNTFDEEKMYLLDSDIQQLLPYKMLLDDEMNAQQPYKFGKVLLAIFKTAYKRTDSILNLLSKQQVNIYAKEKIAVQAQKSYAKNTAELYKRWQLYTKYQMLTTVYGKMAVKKKPLVSAEIVQMATKAYSSIIKKERTDIDNLLFFCNDNSADFETLYLNCIAEGYDPHSAFFSKHQKQEFEGTLNTEDELFGFSYASGITDAEVRISAIMPGSSAWKSQELHVNDIIMGIRFDGTDSLTAEQCNITDIESYLKVNSGKELYLTIRKQDGSIRNVWLRKEKINNEENSVKSFIINGASKIGYINLPAFYTGMKETLGTNSAEDMAKEIVKLKAEKIEGIILDLRYNGGGSLAEAIEMAGIFINEGPIAMYKSNNGKVVSLKDPNRGLVYDGSLVILINGYSASASELLAGSFKALHRAVIVGTPSFGKATSQIIMPLDTTINLHDDKVSFEGKAYNEFVKLTVGNFFDVTGASSQRTGVIPDVLLPDFTNMATAEKESHYVEALPAERVEKNKYVTLLPNLPIQQLVLQSDKRMQANTIFNTVKNAVRNMEPGGTQNIVPLDWDGFENYMNTMGSKVISEKKVTQYFTISNHVEDEKRFMINEYNKKRNEFIKEKLLLDPYIEESFLIAKDLINLQKNK
jgi:carboxyl-terminal processing protease